MTTAICAQERRDKIYQWRKNVGARRNETQWFYEQAEANEAARIILTQYVEELKTNAAITGQSGYSKKARYVIVKSGQMPVFFSKISEEELRLFVDTGFEVYERKEL